MNLEQIEKLIESDYSKYKRTLFLATNSENQYLNSINKFILQKNGKELRPKLSILAARICSGINNLAILVSAAGQMVHNATLMHDDVVDDAKTRRGAPTVGARYTSNVAVLMGDYWLASALSLLNSGFNRRIIHLFSETLRLMSEGEILQMEKSYLADTSFDDYYKIIRCKTGALFVACMQGAAIAVEAKPALEEQIKEYASYLGDAFQIRDDILDYLPTVQTGKPSGLDIKERKITLPLLCALKNNPDKEKKIREFIKSADLEKEAEQIYDFVLQNDGIPSAERILKDIANKAISALSIFPKTPEKEALTFLAEYMGKREF